VLDAASNCRVAVTFEQVGAIVHLAATERRRARWGCVSHQRVKKAHAAARENIRVRIVIGSYAPGPRRLTPR